MVTKLIVMWFLPSSLTWDCVCVWLSKRYQTPEKPFKHFEVAVWEAGKDGREKKKLQILLHGLEIQSKAVPEWTHAADDVLYYIFCEHDDDCLSVEMQMKGINMWWVDFTGSRRRFLIRRMKCTVFYCVSFSFLPVVCPKPYRVLSHHK